MFVINLDLQAVLRSLKAFSNRSFIMKTYSSFSKCSYKSSMGSFFFLQVDLVGDFSLQKIDIKHYICTGDYFNLKSDP